MSNQQRIGVGFGVMMRRQGAVLLGRRNPDPIKASSLLHGEGTWTFPGGKLHFGESFEDGVLRELREETGLEIDPAGLSLVSVSNDVAPDAHFVTFGFLYDLGPGEAKVCEPEEITEWRWFPISNLPTPLFQPSAKILANFLSGRIYKS